MTAIRKLVKEVKAKGSNKPILGDMVDRSVYNRCEVCHALLFLGVIGEGTVIEVKCPRCGEFQIFGRCYE